MNNNTNHSKQLTASVDTPLLTIDQLANHLQVPKSWIYERTRGNSIPHHRIGKYLRFDLEEIDRWIRGDRSVKIEKLVKRRL